MRSTDEETDATTDAIATPRGEELVRRLGLDVELRLIMEIDEVED